MVILALTEGSASAEVQAFIAFLGVVQTIALAVIADRSRRVRRSTRREPDEDSA